MTEPLTINCACGDDRCKMTLTVRPLGAHFKLIMTPRVDDTRKEPAIEWVHAERLAKRLGTVSCAEFGVFFVRHFPKSELDLDMQITEADRLQLLKLARGEDGAEANQEGEGTPAQPEHAGS
jgi:hypothetical protein